MRSEMADAEPGIAVATRAQDGMGAALAYCLRPAHLQRTIAIALVVGTILVLLNHADTLLAGQFSVGLGLKVAANYLVPFMVSNLGLLSGRAVLGGEQGG
ncbi:MAG: nitrate/nitrite transporter NrtS [Candidatus Limnocylindrales bacterium]